MPTNVRPDTKRHLYISPQTVSAGEMQDSFLIAIPFTVQYMAVSNPTGATLQCASGRLTSVPVDAISVQPFNSISAEIEDTQMMTVFWNSDHPIPQPTNATPNRIVFWFSNEPIQLQIGSLSTGEAAQVQVTNTVTAIVEGSDGTDYHALHTDDSGNVFVTLTSNHVNVDSLPELPSGTNSIGHVDVDSIAGVPLATSSGIAPSQVSVGTGPTLLLSGVVNAKQIRIANLDTTNVLFIGGSNVSLSSGYPIFPQTEFIQDIVPGSNIALYGVAAASLNAAVGKIN